MRWSGFLYRFLYSLLCIALLTWGTEPLGEEGDALLKSGRYHDAIDAFRHAIRLNPAQARTHFQLGNTYAALEKYDEAIAAYNQALQQQPEPALACVVYQELGAVYSKIRQDSKAITAFQQARQLAPHDPHIYYALGLAYMREDRPEATATFQTYLRLARQAADQPDEIVAHVKMLLGGTPSDPIEPPETVPPAIVITSHDVSKTVQVSALTAHTTVRGTVSDNSRITRVMVNETAVKIDGQGQFETVLMLEEGDNAIEVSAVDEHQNLGRTAFTIYRLSMDEAVQRRFALVIGNSTYKASPLRNSSNDAQDMAQALERLGFAVVLLLDVNQIEMEHAIERFSQRLRQGGVGLFYYAGHGMQLDGQNFLIPIGAELPDVTYVKYKAVHVGLILDRMEDAGNDLNIIILDACRDNPFRGLGRSSQGGLAVVQAARGSLIAYATGPGEVALDGHGRNGVYTKYLLRYIHQPQLSVEQMFKQVRIAVRDETEGKQIPWETSSLLGDFYFAGQ